jgi:hypothetical protein
LIIYEKKEKKKKYGNKSRRKNTKMNKYLWHILIGVPGVILYFFLFFNLIGRVKKNNMEMLARQKNFLLYSQSKELHGYYLSLEKYISKKLAAYKKFDNVSEGITSLLSLVKSYNLHTKSIFHSAIRETNDISYITVELELTGKYPDLCSFLNRLNSEAFRVEKLKVFHETTGMSFSLRLRLFLSANDNK